MGPPPDRTTGKALGDQSGNEVCSLIWGQKDLWCLELFMQLLCLS